MTRRCLHVVTRNNADDAVTIRNADDAVTKRRAKERRQRDAVLTKHGAKRKQNNAAQNDAAWYDAA